MITVLFKFYGDNTFLENFLALKKPKRIGTIGCKAGCQPVLLPVEHMS